MNLKRNKMATIFNHNKKSLFEALGFDDNDLNNINMKLALSSKYIIIDTPKHSELCEHIAKEFSYNELLFVATLFVTEKTVKILDQNPEVLAAMQLKALLDQLKNEEEL
jgi:hypothetical protein